MNRLLIMLMEKVAQAFKGKAYTLSRQLPASALFAIALSRTMGLLRSVIKGVAVSSNGLAFIGKGVELRNKRYIHISKGVTLGNFVTIDGLSTEGVVLGQSVNIGPYTVLEASGTITNLGKGIRIGARSGIGGFSFIGGAGGVVIGEDVIMGQWVSIHPENHRFENTAIPIRLQGVTRQGIVIEDDCWIGAKVTLLDGAHVGRGSVIAAGAVVRGYIPPYSIAAGIPARVVKSRRLEQPQ